MIKLGLIGCGYWGPNLLRNFVDTPHCQVTMVCEQDPARLDYVRQKFPKIPTTNNHQDVWGPAVDAVAIATPAATHFALAKEALEHGKHVLVEKPLAMTSAQAKELIDISRRNKLKLMVGHTFEYNEAVRTLKRYIQGHGIGKPYYLYAQRLNFGIVRPDVNALWNLAPHDISIMLYVLDMMPVSVSCHGMDFLQKGIEDVVFLVLRFPENVLAHVQVSWLDPGKIRRMTWVGSERMVVYDDVSDDKIKIYDKGFTKKNMGESLGRFDDFGKFQSIRSAGDVVIPKIDFTEPLKVECAHFIEAILENKPILTDGENGWRVVKVLEAASESMRGHGQIVSVT